jgi:hypothetical protein
MTDCGGPCRIEAGVLGSWKTTSAIIGDRPHLPIHAACRVKHHAMEIIVSGRDAASVLRPASRVQHRLRSTWRLGREGLQDQ